MHCFNEKMSVVMAVLHFRRHRLHVYSCDSRGISGRQLHNKYLGSQMQNIIHVMNIIHSTCHSAACRYK